MFEGVSAELCDELNELLGKRISLAETFRELSSDREIARMEIHLALANDLVQVREASFRDLFVGRQRNVFELDVHNLSNVMERAEVAWADQADRLTRTPRPPGSSRAVQV